MARSVERVGRWLVSIAALGLMAASAHGQPAPGSGSENAFPAAIPLTPELEEAAKIFRSGDFEKAIKAVQAATQKNPELPPTPVIVAGWFAAANQTASVRNLLEQAVASVPNDPEAYQLLGDLAVRAREFAAAGLLYEKGLALARSVKEPNPRIVAVKRRSLAGLGAVAMARQDWPTAQTHLEALISEDPKDATVLQQFGQVLFMQKKEDLALEKLREAAKLNPNLLAAEATLAQYYQQAGDVKNAGKWMLEAIKANLRDAKVRATAAQWSYEIGKLDQAEEQAKAAVQLDPGSLGCQLVRGMVALARKDYKTAQEYYEKAHLQTPSTLNVTDNLVLALAGQDDDAKKRLALEYAQISIRVFPEQAEAFSTFGWALYRSGRIDEAEAALRKAASMARPSPDTLYFLARVMAARGNKEEAKSLLTPAAMKNPGPRLMRKDAEALAEELSAR
jgi:tetratricopeptide (TPR) repeat protein